MDHCFEQAIFIALFCVAMKMQQQASVCWLSISLWVDLCSVLIKYVNANKAIKEILFSIGSSIVKDRLDNNNDYNNF